MKGEESLTTSGDRYATSVQFHERARRTLARGVGSAMRATHKPVPLRVERASGPYLYDGDGHEYVDFVLGYGPLLLGHSPTAVLDAVRSQLERGIAFGAEHEPEVALAEAIVRLVPSAEACVFSNTGSEAVQVALRIARAATNRNRVLKFKGHYHGWLDAMHVGVPGREGSGPGTEGQDPGAAASVTVCEWNDIAALERLLTDDFAAVIMEPICVNGGGYRADPAYLGAVRAKTQEVGALLIFDEVITGFRVDLGGAQALLDVEPDLTVLGKALGAGFPISAVCGSSAALEVVKDGRVAHMGNYNANPVCSTASLAAIEYLEAGGGELYSQLTEMTMAVTTALADACSAAGLPLWVNSVPGAAFAFVSARPVESHDDRLAADAERYARFARNMLDEGVHLAPRGLIYVSTEHTAEHVALLRSAAERAAQRTVTGHASDERIS